MKFANPFQKSPPPLAATATEAAPPKKKKKHQGDGVRETVESLVIAFILAFVFRTFEAEAFIIPTGSMAPTLFGRNKEMTCSECGYTFTFGASGEMETETLYNPHKRLQQAICPNCRYQHNDAENAPVFNGDRILVNKFPYEFETPDRFDVVVFKYPMSPKTNYIKRLVGLPNETIHIQRGDVYRIDPETHKRAILRKDDPYKQKEIQIPIYDDRFPPTRIIEKGWPERWASVTPQSNSTASENVAGWYDSTTGWQADRLTRTYTLTSSPDANWLRYRHFIPSPEAWKEADSGRVIRNPQPRLISDFCGYNSAAPTTSTLDYLEDGIFWVGDLTVDATLKIDEVNPDATLVLECVEGVYRYRFLIDPNTGLVSVGMINTTQSDTEWIEFGTGTSSLQGPGTYNIEFANVDDRLCLWINNSLVDFGGANSYERKPTDSLRPQPSDFSPVGIAARNVTLTVSNLVLKRDIYYRGQSNFEEYISPSDPRYMWLKNLRNHLNDPSAWSEEYYPLAGNYDEYEINISEDEFFMLGDNSPMSLDGREWQREHTVPRHAISGKAFFIYWPHGIPFGGKDGNGYPIKYHTYLKRVGNQIVPTKDDTYPLITLPFYPNVSRMHRIR